MKTLRVLMPVALAGGVGCAGEAPEPAPVDVQVVGGTIHLEVGRTTDQLGLIDGVVVAAGADVPALVDGSTQVVDLGGAVAWPGFIDNHVHLLAGSFVFERLLLLGTSSMDSLLSKVESYAEREPDEPWIVGYGWMRELIDDPSGVALDEVVSDRPVLLVDNSGHSALVNSVAMALAGIDADTPDPDDGEIVRDEDGQPTGLLIEGALALVSEAALQDYDDAALGGGLTSALDEFVDGGITGVAEVVASPGFDLTRPWIYQELEAAGELDLRVHVYVPVFEPDDIHDAVAWADELDGERVRFAGAKLWVDGSMGTGDSWVSEPLTDDPDDFGSAYFTAEELVEVVADAEALGVPLKLHANGDQAVAVALDAFEEQAAGDGLVLPHTLDHVVLIGADDRARMAELGIVANLQPAHWIGAQAGDVVDQWGEERFDTAYDARALVDAEVTVSIGTDWPVWPSPSAPVNLWAASVVRGPDQGLSREEALTAYTAGSAAGVGQSQLGCLDVGCVADMVTFDSDPLAVDDGALGQLEVTGVWLAGEQVR